MLSAASPPRGAKVLNTSVGLGAGSSMRPSAWRALCATLGSAFVGCDIGSTSAVTSVTMSEHGVETVSAMRGIGSTFTGRGNGSTSAGHGVDTPDHVNDIISDAVPQSGRGSERGKRTTQGSHGFVCSVRICRHGSAYKPPRSNLIDVDD